MLCGSALALERVNLLLQLLKRRALLLELGAQDAQALVPGFDLLVKLDAVGVADQPSAALVDGRLLGQPPILIRAVVDCLHRGTSGRGVRREVPVRDARPGGADLDQLFLLDLAGAAPLGSVHLDGALADPVLGAEPFGLRLLHGAALAVLEVVQLLPARSLGRGPVLRGDRDALAAVALDEVPALALLRFGARGETLRAEIERRHQNVRVGVAAAPIVVDRPVARLRGEERAEVAHAPEPSALVQLDGQCELEALGHELLAAAHLGPDALGLVPQRPAVDGRRGGGQGQALGGHALLAGIVAEPPRPLLHERLPRLVGGLADRAGASGGRAAADVQMVDGHASSFQARVADATRAAVRRTVSRGRRTVPAARSARKRTRPRSPAPVYVSRPRRTGAAAWA